MKKELQRAPWDLGRHISEIRKARAERELSGRQWAIVVHAKNADELASELRILSYVGGGLEASFSLEQSLHYSYNRLMLTISDGSGAALRRVQLEPSRLAEEMAALETASEFVTANWSEGPLEGFLAANELLALIEVHSDLIKRVSLFFDPDRLELPVRQVDGALCALNLLYNDEYKKSLTLRERLRVANRISMAEEYPLASSLMFTGGVAAAFLLFSLVWLTVATLAGSQSNQSAAGIIAASSVLSCVLLGVGDFFLHWRVTRGSSKARKVKDGQAI